MRAPRSGSGARALVLWHRVTGSFWAVPAAMCLAALVVSQVLITVDRSLGAGWTAGLGPLGVQSGPSGSRYVLSAIAGSMLGVASTTFSITIAVMTLTSSSYGPRLVRSFMSDRTTHVVLGTFVSTSLYALLVLRAVTSEQEAVVAFVPHLAVLLAVLAAIACIAVLVYFVHHVSEAVQVSTLSRRVCDDLRDAVGRLYPEDVGEPARRSEHPALPPGVARAPRPDGVRALAGGAFAGVDGAPGALVHAGGCGYVGEIALEAVAESARRHDVLVVVRSRPGSYAVDATPLLEVHPAGRADARLLGELRGCVDLAKSRTPGQDVELLVQQLVELLSRALSSGVNDPFTAVTALDDLSGGLVLLVGRRTPDAERVDDDGVVRLVADPVTALELVDLLYDALRAYAATTPMVLLHAVEVAERLDAAAVDPVVPARLREHLGLLLEAHEAAGPLRHDLERMRARSAAMLGPVVPAGAVSA